MRFRFCGGEDCPDWLLAEISSLAAVSVVKVRQLTAEVSQSCRNYISWIHLLLGICHCIWIINHKLASLNWKACQLLAEDKQVVPERLSALVADTKLQPKEVCLSCNSQHKYNYHATQHIWWWRKHLKCKTSKCFSGQFFRWPPWWLRCIGLYMGVLEMPLNTRWERRGLKNWTVWAQIVDCSSNFMS